LINLVLLLSVLLALHRWLLEPLMHGSAAVFELGGLPWLVLTVLAWLLAGR
jgi:hypothetical protein